VSGNELKYEASTILAAAARAHVAPMYGGALRTCGPDAGVSRETSAFTNPAVTSVLVTKPGVGVGDDQIPMQRLYVPGIPPRSRRT
jgi:hypothetical protein